jgi:hypothetical protein
LEEIARLLIPGAGAAQASVKPLPWYLRRHTAKPGNLAK